MVTIGIAALFWEHVELLPEFVRLMREQPIDELILVDNASGVEANLAYQIACAQIGPQARVLRMAQNDVVAGWNAGLNALTTDIVIQMADDVVMTNSAWLQWAIADMRVGRIQGPYLKELHGVFYLDGCLCVYMRSDWKRLGGLDADYEHPGYWSDVDICLRARQLGMTVRPVRGGIRHLVGVSTGGAETAAGRRAFRANQERFLVRLRADNSGGLPGPGATAPLQWTETRTASAVEPLRIAWAPFASENAPSGYGVIARGLRLALSEAGAHILSPTVYGWDCVVAISLPAAWVVGASRQRRDLCIHSMYEMDHLPREWPQVLNGASLVWVPSAYSEQVFRDAGVTVPIMRSGYGIDPSLFHAGERQSNTGPMRFIAWGTAHIGRKNTLMAARAFKAAHLPEHDATLEIKVNEAFGEPYFKDADNDNRIIPNISAVAGNWPTSTLADWLRQADVLIYPSGGEGFGLMPLEAMGCGVLPICAYNTGMIDYLDMLPALQVPCPTQVPSASYSALWNEQLLQWQPDFDALVEHIRWCYANRDAVTARGAQCAELVARHWTWQQAGTRALRMLEAHFGS